MMSLILHESILRQLPATLNLKCTLLAVYRAAERSCVGASGARLKPFRELRDVLGASRAPTPEAPVMQAYAIGPAEHPPNCLGLVRVLWE